jgi:hypothetical protein
MTAKNISVFLRVQRLTRACTPPCRCQAAQRLRSVLSREEASVDPNSWAFSYHVRAKSRRPLNATERMRRRRERIKLGLLAPVKASRGDRIR